MSEVPIFEAPENDVPFFNPPEEEHQVVPPPPSNYTLFWPFMVVLFTLVASCVRDIVTIRAGNEQTTMEEAHLGRLLINSGLQARSLESLEKDLSALAQNDPVAQQIVADFTPPSAPAHEHAGPPAPPKPGAK